MTTDAANLLVTPLDDLMIKRRMKEFMVAGKYLSINRCASCGEKKIDDNKFATMDLSDVDSLLCDEKRQSMFLDNASIQQYLTIFQHENKLYDLHSNLLREAPSGWQVPLCGTCVEHVEKGIRPKFNVGNGCDYGRNIPQLSVAEAILTSRTILFQTVFNLNGTDVKVCRGHTISFEHNGATAFAEQLPRLDIKDLLQVTFIGSKEKFSSLTKLGEWRNKFLAAHRQLRVDPQRVIDFLRIKAHVDPEYKHIEVIDVERTVHALERLQNELFDNAIISEDLAAQKAAKEAGAKMTVDEIESDGESDSPSPQTLLPSENIYVHRKVCPPVANTANILNIANQAINGSGQFLSVAVGAMPTDEFAANEKVFLGGFANLFFLGEGVPQGSGSLPASLVEHLLLQYDNRFATSAHFLFAIFNQIQRHAAASNITFRVKSGNKAFTAFKRLMATPDFASQLSLAAQDPTSVTSKQLARTVLDIAEISGRAIPWSGMERKSALCKIIALTHYAGPYSFFVTVASKLLLICV